MISVLDASAMIALLRDEVGADVVETALADAESICFAHAINLCDMNAKYADVVKTSEVLTFLDTLPHGMFDLPKGKPAPPREQKRAAGY